MGKVLDHVKLDKLRVKALKASKQTKAPDVEDMPYDGFTNPPEGLDELTDEEFDYLIFGIKPD
ncbi:hypothetical protein [Staphylococcus pseudintermedius]|uniref:hypothetical protein n=1 Tax=Staphylococcus pseudintermedius TaxID=283734 RepID=UPI001032B17B|nr:hypothetical protein [Staphylococcus pseudintermedius]QBG75096.1 hypothetical protein EW134_06325 [Staphylococcus pseudintermedius]HAR6618691.1 hypothetical protein [Staphylococcus pseudintermedius]